MHLSPNTLSSKKYYDIQIACIFVRLAVTMIVKERVPDLACYIVQLLY